MLSVLLIDYEVILVSSLIIPCEVEMQCMLSVLVMKYEAFLVSTLMFNCVKQPIP